VLTSKERWNDLRQEWHALQTQAPVNNTSGCLPLQGVDDKGERSYLKMNMTALMTMV
jgi:hypothetical protein